MLKEDLAQQRLAATTGRAGKRARTTLRQLFMVDFAGPKQLWQFDGAADVAVHVEIVVAPVSEPMICLGQQYHRILVDALVMFWIANDDDACIT